MYFRESVIIMPFLRDYIALRLISKTNKTAQANSLCYNWVFVKILLKNFQSETV